MRSSSENIRWEGALQESPKVQCPSQKTVAQHQECFLKHLLKLPVIRAPLCSTVMYFRDTSLYSAANFLKIAVGYVSLQFEKLWS